MTGVLQRNDRKTTGEKADAAHPDPTRSHGVERSISNCNCNLCRDLQGREAEPKKSGIRLSVFDSLPADRSVDEIENSELLIVDGQLIGFARGCQADGYVGFLQAAEKLVHAPKRSGVVDELLSIAFALTLEESLAPFIGFLRQQFLEHPRAIHTRIGLQILQCERVFGFEQSFSPTLQGCAHTVDEGSLYVENGSAGCYGSSHAGRYLSRGDCKFAPGVVCMPLRVALTPSTNARATLRTSSCTASSRSNSS